MGSGWNEIAGMDAYDDPFSKSERTTQQAAQNALRTREYLIIVHFVFHIASYTFIHGRGIAAIYCEIRANII